MNSYIFNQFYIFKYFKKEFMTIKVQNIWNIIIDNIWFLNNTSFIKEMKLKNVEKFKFISGATEFK